MKHLKSYNEASKNDILLDVNTLDGTVVDIFSGLTDIGYSIEVLHQNGYASYNLLPPTDEYKESQKVIDAFNGSEGFGRQERDKNLLGDKVVSGLEGYANFLLKLSKELPEARSQMMSLPGIKEFYVTMSGHIMITFHHKPQGFGNLGNVMLVGSKDRSVYGG